MKTYLKYIIAGLIIILLLFTNYCSYNLYRNGQNKFNSYETTIKALNDTITYKDGQYSKSTIQIDLNTLLESEYFKQLDKQNKEYFNELQKIKGLIASNKVTIIKQDTIINSNADTSLKGHIVFEDTTKAFKYRADISLYPHKLDLSYTYSPTLVSTLKKEKDGSMRLYVSFDDPDLKVKDMKSFIIPMEETSKFNKWIIKNKIPIGFTIGGVGILSGLYIGTKL